jgi:hypothetical protein
MRNASTEIEKPEEKKLLTKSKHRLEDNIKMDI